VIGLPRLAAALLLLASGCSNAPPATHAAVFRAPPPLRITTQHEPLRGYRLAPSFVAKGPFQDGAPLRVGAIVDGLRVRPEAGGLRFAESIAMPALQGGIPLPQAVGGGLLFWNDSALYTADSFLGRLTPLLGIGFLPAQVSFGPNFALVRGSDGERLALDLFTRERVAIFPPLLADIAATAGGRSLALLEGGGCQFSEDAGKSYRPLALPAGARAVSVREKAGELLAKLTSDQQIRVDVAGKMQLEGAPRAAPARPLADSLWPLAEPPLERALAFGVPIGEEFAGVAVAGSVATVNLRTGELVQMTRALVPSELACRTLDVHGALLVACNSPINGSLVLSDAFGERPLTQARFGAGVTLDFAEGVLVASARCDGAVRAGAVCVRSVDGRFHDFDVSAQLAKLQQPAEHPAAGGPRVLTAPSIVRWVPKVGGGAVAVIGGSAPGMLDAQTGNFVAIAPDMPRGVIEAERRPEVWLGLDWVALKDGSVRGWLPTGGVAIAHDGRLEPSVYEFSHLAGAGAHALAIDRGRRVFQTSDWGRTWVETMGPPGSASAGHLNSTPRCSAVGCLLGPWLRVGWQPEVPAALLRTQNVAPAPPGVARDGLATLSCKQLSAPVVALQPPAASDLVPSFRFGMSQPTPATEADYVAAFAWATVHPILGTGEPLELRASLVTRVPEDATEDPPAANWAGYSSVARVAFVSAFEPSGRIQNASIRLRVLFDAARAAGYDAPSFRPEQVDGLPALPVLGLNAGEAGGLILDGELPLWVHGSGIEALVAGDLADDAKWIGAVQSAPNKLAMLSGRPDGSLDVFEFVAGRGRRLFQIPGLAPPLYPRNPDSLALGARGELAILRSPSGREPATLADPAVLLHEDGTVSVLAPWSRLSLADAPECKPAADDYRAVLQTSQAWLQLIEAGQPASDAAVHAGMFALLRGNADRLCLEAVELADAPANQGDSSHETRLSARFVGRERSAARLGFAPGFEFRQALSCGLSGAH